MTGSGRRSRPCSSTSTSRSDSRCRPSDPEPGWERGALALLLHQLVEDLPGRLWAHVPVVEAGGISPAARLAEGQIPPGEVHDPAQPPPVLVAHIQLESPLDELCLALDATPVLPAGTQ